MRVLLNVVWLATPDDLASRLEATAAVDPDAAERAIALLIDDPRVLARPTLVTRTGERAAMEMVRELPVVDDGGVSWEALASLRLEALAAPIDDGVRLALTLSRDTREPEPDPEHDGAWRIEGEPAPAREVALDALAGRTAIAAVGDWTLLVRPVLDPAPGDVRSWEPEGRDPSLPPRARRRAIERLLLDPERG